MLYPQYYKFEEKMIKRQAGFTMAELLVTMAIFMFAIVAMSNVFVPLLTQFKQQSRIAETQIEGAIGLQILGKDLEQAGFGLPWVIPAAVTYNEGATSSGSIPSADNPAINDATNNPPRAITGINNVSGLGGSDYLVIKATSIAMNDAAMKWTHVIGAAASTSTVNVWGNSTEDLDTNDLAIVLIPSRGGDNQRILVNSGATFYISFDPTTFPPAFSPSTENDVYLVYGVTPPATDVTGLRMPFNRSDYYIDRESTTVIPPRCAAGTGILMKTLISHADGNRMPGMPLLDCVADMQVIFRLDRDNDGTIDAATEVLTDTSGAALTARELREQLKEVRVYILAHEGQKDVNYTYPSDSVDVGEFGIGNVGDDAYDLTPITDWQRYRWKVYTIVVKPNNLRS
jgi:prepilin-type N-terminal cleavage/methylation domain-containing protein